MIDVVRRRARPLPPAERRAALIAATLPLISEHGADVSTRQIAEAADVAEGTIFRVFPDKAALIDAAVDAAFDPAPVVAQLRGIEAALPLQQRVSQAVRIMQQRITQLTSLMIALRLHRPPDDERRPARAVQATEAVHEALTALFEPHRDALRVTPREAAKVLRLLVFAGSHPIITDGKPLSAKQIVAVFLDGVRGC